MRKWGIVAVVVLLFAGWLAGIGSWASPKAEAAVSESLTPQDVLRFANGPPLHWRSMVMCRP